MVPGTWYLVPGACIFYVRYFVEVYIYGVRSSTKCIIRVLNTEYLYLAVGGERVLASYGNFTFRTGKIYIFVILLYHIRIQTVFYQAYLYIGVHAQQLGSHK